MVQAARSGKQNIAEGIIAWGTGTDCRRMLSKMVRSPLRSDRGEDSTEAVTFCHGLEVSGIEYEPGPASNPDCFTFHGKEG